MTSFDVLWFDSQAWTFAFMFHVTYLLIVWSGTLAYLAIDTWNLFPQFKIQPNKWPEPSLIRAAFKEQIVHSLTNPLLLWLIYTYGLSGRVRFSGPLDSWGLFAVKSVAVFLFLDFCFYFQHRFCHIPKVYQLVHKQHHKFRVSAGVAFEYAHIVEGLFVNGLPLFVAFYFADFHVLQMAFFFGIRLTETIDAHGGYDFPWSPWRYLSGAVNHDMHHSHNIGNFGMFWFWDWFLGTRTSDARKQMNSK